MNDYVTVQNLDTGEVSQIRRSLAEHALFGARLEIVPAGTKRRVRLSALVKPKPQARLREPAEDVTEETPDPSEKDSE